VERELSNEKGKEANKINLKKICTVLRQRAGCFVMKGFGGDQGHELEVRFCLQITTFLFKSFSHFQPPLPNMLTPTFLFKNSATSKKRVHSYFVSRLVRKWLFLAMSWCYVYCIIDNTRHHISALLSIQFNYSPQLIYSWPV
jgi:hypothetical protein